MLKSCFFNKKDDSLILHFTTRRLTDYKDIVNQTTLKPIYYEPITPSISYEDFSGYMTERLKECDKMSVIIVIDANLATSIPGYCNHFFGEMKGIKLHNVNLINIITTGRFSVHELPILRKSINIGFQGTYGSFYGDSFDLSGRITLNRIFVRRDGKGNKALFKIMSTLSSTGSRLIDQWWFRAYFSIPPCANFRLTQSTGTCWLNALINSMFLSEPISAMIKQRFIPGTKTVSLRNFGNKGLGLYTLFNSLVYHLLITQTKATEEDGNFMGYLAAAVKCKYSNVSGPQCESIPYGSGGIPFKAAAIALNGLLNQNDFLVIDPFSFMNQYRNKEVSHYNYLVRSYNQAIRSWKGKHQADQLQLELRETSRKLESLNKSSEDVFKGRVSFVEMFKRSYFNFLASPRLIVLSVPSQYKSLSKSFVHKGYTYNLESCVIGLFSAQTRSYHSIAGFTCGGKLFVYDSNNFLAECDWAAAGRGGLEPYFNSDESLKRRRFEFSTFEIAFYLK